MSSGGNYSHKGRHLSPIPRHTLFLPTSHALRQQHRQTSLLEQGGFNHSSLFHHLRHQRCKGLLGLLFLRGRFNLQEWRLQHHQQPCASALSSSSCDTSHPADHHSLWLAADGDDGIQSLGLQELSSSSTPYPLPLSSFDFFSPITRQLDDTCSLPGTAGLDDLTTTTLSSGFPDILHESIPDLELSTLDIPPDNNLLGVSEDPLVCPDFNLPMYDPKVHFDHPNIYNHSSPSSTTTTTAVLTHPHSTPTFSLLDDGSLTYNDNASLFPPYPDHSRPSVANTNTTPISETSQSQPTNLHPGLSLPQTSQVKGTKRGRPTASEASDRDASPVDADIIVKRQRNNIAAKKYRQKKIDRIEELEAEVDEIKKERDELRIQLAKREAETAALREMLKMATKQQNQ